MRIIDILQEKCIASGVELGSKEQALQQVVTVAKRHPALADIPDDVISDALNERESLGSTGFGDGIAIPHCRLEGISEFIIGIITVPGGVEFEALDGKDVKLIIFIIAPSEKSNDHIKLLSAVSQTLMIPGAVKEIIAGRSDESVRESFLRHTRDEIDTKEQAGKSLFTITIQDETIFRDMVGALSGIDSNLVTVIEAENAGAYLAKMPLFADFWSDKKHPFCKVILATVEKGLTNETLRRIEALTGCLNDRDDVLVTIQELAYWAGSIQV
jgi:PTS system nitrogen regulatory IIA component